MVQFRQALPKFGPSLVEFDQHRNTICLLGTIDGGIEARLWSQSLRHAQHACGFPHDSIALLAGVSAPWPEALHFWSLLPQAPTRNAHTMGYSSRSRIDIVTFAYALGAAAFGRPAPVLRFGGGAWVLCCPPARCRLLSLASRCASAPVWCGQLWCNLKAMSSIPRLPHRSTICQSPLSGSSCTEAP